MSVIKNVEALGKNSIVQDITFDNDSGPVSVFTVTGDVIVRMIIVCTTNVASAAAATIELGISAITDAMLATTVATELDAREIWNDNVPSREIEAVDSLRGYIITDGNDIVLTMSDQVDSGVLRFYCFWTPLSSGASIVSV